MQTHLKAGNRIRLISMPDDPHPIPAGSTGTVVGIHPHDGWIQVDVCWDTGRSMMLCVPPDQIERLEPKDSTN